MHPYSVGGAPRFWYLISRAMGLIAFPALFVAFCVVAPYVSPAGYSRAAAIESLNGAFVDDSRAMALLVVSGIVVAASMSAAEYARRQAWSAIPGGTVRRFANSPLRPPGAVPRWIDASLMVLHMTFAVGLGLALSSRGVLGSILVVFVFTTCAVLSGGKFSELLYAAAWLPGLVSAVAVLVQTPNPGTAIAAPVAFSLILAVIPVTVYLSGARKHDELTSTPA